MPTDNLEFWGLLTRLCKYNLSIKEIKYLLWKFCCKKKLKEIARLDDRKPNNTGKAYASFIIQRAYRKIKSLQN